MIERLPAVPLADPDRLPVHCQCGKDDRYEQRRQHAAWHLLWSRGVPIPDAAYYSGPPDPERPVTVVRPTDPIAWRRIAYQFAQLVQREQGWDFPSFPTPVGRGQDDERHTRAYLYQVNNTVVGYLAAGDDPTFGWFDFAVDTVPRGEDRHIRPAIGVLFVAQQWRRHGIGGALVRALADHAGVPVGELAWGWPLTDAGVALARSLAGGTGGVWIT